MAKSICRCPASLSSRILWTPATCLISQSEWRLCGGKRWLPSSAEARRQTSFRWGRRWRSTILARVRAILQCKRCTSWRTGSMRSRSARRSSSGSTSRSPSKSKTSANLRILHLLKKTYIEMILKHIKNIRASAFLSTSKWRGGGCSCEGWYPFG